MKQTEQEEITLHFIFGSTSDFTKEIAAIIQEFYEREGVNVKINILSCHRHLIELFFYLFRFPRDHKTNRIIATGSMAFALPGIIRTILNILRNRVQVIGVALGGKDPIHIQAAVLSILCLPGKPVLMDENGEPYAREDGFRRACLREVGDEIPPFEFKQSPPCYTDLTYEGACGRFLQ